MKKFVIDVPDSVLVDLKQRILRTRWPDQINNNDWAYGVELGYLKEVLQYWAHEYDWRKHEVILNRVPQFQTEIDGLNIHFLYVRGKGPSPTPIILTHGWPSSFAEWLSVIGPLTDPAKFGGQASDSFDVVVPSIPGFAFSEQTKRPGWLRVDNIWRKLMTDVLGYQSFMAHGCDVGARITSDLGRYHQDVVEGIHLGSVDLEWPDPLPDSTDMSKVESAYIERVERWEREEGAYAEVQSTYPQTLAYALNDSPAGLAAWIIDKFRAWSECEGQVEKRFSKDTLLTNITIYWATSCINSSMRRYYEARHRPTPHQLALGERIETPTGIAMFPGEKELVVPRSWAERCYNIQHWTDMPSGGHFPAHEEPELLVEDIRQFAKTLRS